MPLDWPIGCPRHLKKNVWRHIHWIKVCYLGSPERHEATKWIFFFSGGHNKEFLLDGRAASFWKCSTWSQPVRENLLWKENKKKWSNRWNSLCLERQKRWGGWKKVRAIEYIYIYAIIREDQSRWFHYLLPKISSSWILIKLCLLLLLLSWEKQKCPRQPTSSPGTVEIPGKKNASILFFFFSDKKFQPMARQCGGVVRMEVSDRPWWHKFFLKKWGFSILFCFCFVFSALTVCVCPIGSGRGLGGW